MEDAASIVARLTELSYAVDTFYLLVTGALVMWMAAGFTMLEAGLVRAKNTAEILTKNIGLYSVACIMYMLCGYAIMYPDAHAGGVFQSLLSVGRGLVGNTDHSNVKIGKAGRRRWMGWRPAVRGIAMDPRSHPHGGGEGRSPIGMAAPKTPWGKPALGVKTRRNKVSSQFIVRRRGKKR